MTRLACASAVASGRAAAESDPEVRQLDRADWASVMAFDSAVFGADRSGVLRDLAQRVPRAALVAEREGRICGASFARDGRLAVQLGPLVATDDATARALVAAALAEIAAPVFIDVADRHARIGAWLREMGFTAQRPLIRMAHGRDRAFDDPGRLFAVAGPELG
jgi:hypothetical protein